MSPKKPRTGQMPPVDHLRWLRVLQIGKYYPPYRGGMETHLEQLSSFLKRTVDLEVLVSNDKLRTSREVIDGVRVTRLARLCTLGSTPVCPTMARSIADAVPDLVHIHFPHPTAILAYMTTNHRGPLVVTWHSDIVRQAVLGKLFRPVLDSFLRRCSAVVVSSLNYLESSEMLRAYHDKCHVIPFGIAVDRFQRADPDAVAAIRTQYGPRVILAVGRLVYYKGFQFLIRALTQVRCCKLLIIGEGPLRAELEREATLCGVRNRVVFLGAVADPVPYYTACDIFALPSIARSEAFGIVQLEALAAGKPVVNTLLSSGVPYVSLDGVTGFSVAPRNSQALAKALNTLFEESAVRVRFGQQALARVKREFGVEQMFDRTHNLYSHLIAEHPATIATSVRRSPDQSADWT
jgi:glycosyltransferase involved in cell wall biosynthesis